MTKKESRPLIQIDNEIREMNDQEFSLYQSDVIDFEKRQSADIDRQASRESALAKLAKLGLSEEEIASL